MTRKAIVSGALANKPFNGGNAWSRMSWVRGLQELGFQVLFVEEIRQEHCVDEYGSPARFEGSANQAYFESVMTQFGLENNASLICDGGAKVCGIPLDIVVAYAGETSLLFNISGHLTIPEVKRAVACKLYYDDDPGFTQFWHAAGTNAARLEGHDFYFTIGMNIGLARCKIPTDGIKWEHTRPPAVLQDWPASSPPELPRFTTVASWRGAYGSIEFQGKTYGSKVHEFRKFLGLPRLSGGQFEIALQIDPADRKDLDSLSAHGWSILDPRKAAGSCDLFRTYVQNSGAEFSVAQGIYVDTNSGWFSDRTVRYLASGRPALVQETGFSNHIPTGKGLLSFRSMDEAIDGAKRIARDYAGHCRSARKLASEFFDADKVIRELAGNIGLALPETVHSH